MTKVAKQHQVLPFNPDWIGKEGFFTNFPYPYLPEGVAGYTGTYELEGKDGSRYARLYTVYNNRIEQQLGDRYKALIFPGKIHIIETSYTGGRDMIGEYKRMRAPGQTEETLFLSMETRICRHIVDNRFQRPVTAGDWFVAAGRQYERAYTKLLLPEGSNTWMPNGEELPYTARIRPNRRKHELWWDLPAPLEWDELLTGFQKQVETWEVIVGERVSQLLLSHHHNEVPDDHPVIAFHLSTAPVGPGMDETTTVMQSVAMDVQRRYCPEQLPAEPSYKKAPRAYHLLKDTPMLEEVAARMAEYWKEFYVALQTFRNLHKVPGVPFDTPAYVDAED